MRRRLGLATALTLTIALVPILAAQPAYAGGSKPSSTAITTGVDVSWPQCGQKLPTGQGFGIVGVNGGTAASFNPCVAAQTTWARSTSGATVQPKVQYYINTANPAGQGSWWPTSDASTPPRGTAPYPVGSPPVLTVTYPDGSPVGCALMATGSPSYDGKCAYVYGYVRAEEAVQWAREQVSGFTPSAYRWWLDVETMNTWQSDKTANAASLAGAAAYLAEVGARVGVYSTTAQWTAIVGGIGTNIPRLPNGAVSNLVGLDEWGAGASSAKVAQANCTSATPFTGGSNRLMQYVSNGVDYNVSC